MWKLLGGRVGGERVLRLHFVARSRARPDQVLQFIAVSLDMGDVPAWLQVVGGSAQLAQAMWAHHRSRADDLRKQLEARAGDEQRGDRRRCRC